MHVRTRTFVPKICYEAAAAPIDVRAFVLLEWLVGTKVFLSFNDVHSTVSCHVAPERKKRILHYNSSSDDWICKLDDAN